ncbi:hypothetical protein [Pseudomonas umsongensis]|uniref:hypothetical protein n=1 Tax=Pseudomonas umsongensis TaxID=198618 RepID=UPI003ECE4135
MSMKETIAQLTGVLRFDVESSGFQRFNRMMLSANKQLSALAKEYEQLSKAMAKGLKLKVDTSAVDKAKQKLDAALKRQQRAESALGNQQRQTFIAELTQQKLKYTNTKAQATLDNAALQSKKEGAVVAAKAQAAQAKAAGTTRQQLASQNALTASLARQAKLEAIVQKTRAAAQKANTQHLASMTKVQRLQQQMNHAQQQAHYRAQQHSAKLAAAQQTLANKAQASSQSQQRFQMAQQRHAAWQARQAAPAPRSGMFGGVGMSPMLALGGVGAAIAALTLAANKLGERVEKRQESVKDAETFNAMFSAISPDQKLQTMWRDNYLKSQVENGGVVDTDTAKDFRNFVMAQNAYGKTPDKIMKAWDLRQKAFTIGGASKEDSKEMNKQLGQMAADGTGSKQDYDIIGDRMPMLTPYLVRAYGEENKIKDPKEALTKFNKELKAGKGVKYSWYERAMETMVGENQQTLADRKNTVSYAKQMQENQAFLNENKINTDAELSNAIKDNIQAHRELNEALQPTKQLLKDFDEGLTQAQTGLIRFAIGLNQDGSKKTEQQQAQDRMTTQDLPVDLNMVGTHDYSNIDGNTQHQGGPIGEFWNWALGIKDKPKNSDSSPLLGATPSMSLDTSKLPDFGQSYSTDALVDFATKLPTLSDSFKRMQDGMATSNQMQASQGQTFNAPITVEGANVNVTINGSATEKDRQEMMTYINTELDKQNRAMPTIAQQAINNMLGTARAQQAELQ